MKKLILFLACLFAASCAFTPATKPLDIAKDPVLEPIQHEKQLPFLMADEWDSEINIKEVFLTWVKLGGAEGMMGEMPMFVGMLGNPKVNWSKVDLSNEAEMLNVKIPPGEVTAFIIAILTATPDGNIWLIGYVYNTKNETISYLLNENRTRYIEKERKPLVKLKGVVINNGIEI